jgi:hypothetical protein
VRKFILDAKKALLFLSLCPRDIDHVLLLATLCADVLQGSASALQTATDAAGIDLRDGTPGAEVFRPAKV